MILVTLCCNNSIQQANLSGQSVEKRSCLDAALDVAKFMTARYMILVTLVVLIQFNRPTLVANLLKNALA